MITSSAGVSPGRQSWETNGSVLARSMVRAPTSSVLSPRSCSCLQEGLRRSRNLLEPASIVCENCCGRGSFDQSVVSVSTSSQLLPTTPAGM